MASMLDCKKIQAGLSEYIDGTLGEAETWATQQHLGSCAVCAQIAQELTQTTRLLAFLPRVEPSESFEAALAARLAQQSLKPRAATLGERFVAWWGQPRVRPALASGLALAAVVPVVVVLTRPVVKPLPTAATPISENAPLEAALQDHLSATTAEAFGGSSGVLLASARAETETGS